MRRLKTIYNVPKTSPRVPALPSITAPALLVALLALSAAMPLRAQPLAPAGQLAPAPPPRLYLASESSAPSSMEENGEIVGRNTDKVREIMRRSGIQYGIDLLPWKRAYMLVQGRADMCVFAMSRTPEREKLFKWVGPLDEAEWTFYGLAEHSFQLNSLEDARQLRIGTYNGDARDDFLRTRGFHVDPAQNDMTNAQKLLMKRIDIWPVAMRAGMPPLAQPEWNGRIVPLYTFNRVGISLACNPAVPDALIEQMSAALESMRRDGSIARIDKKYENWGASK